MNLVAQTADLDLYAVLEVHPKASSNEIKENYRRLARTLHPDKLAPQAAGSSSTAFEDGNARFQQIQEAWTVLSDPQTRSAYDALHYAGQVAALPVGAEVDLDDMTFDEGRGVYTHPCRCGHQYEVSEEALEKGEDTHSCAGCSFVIRVTYDVATS